MYNTSKVITQFSKVLGWRNFYDLTEIPSLGSPLNDTETGQYYQDFHPALDLEYIKATLRDNDTLSGYLERTEQIVIPQMLNKVVKYKQLEQTIKVLLNQSVIHTGDGYYKDKIINEGRFVGISVRVHDNKGLKTIIKRFGIQATSAQTDLDVYLFHSSKKDPVQIIQFNSTQGDLYQWNDFDTPLEFENGDDILGGCWFIGYYQDDLTGQAIEFKKLNWSTGYCSGCDGGAANRIFSKFLTYVDMSPFYVAADKIGTKGELFDPSDIIRTYTNNYGININFTVECDLTHFWIQNRQEFTELLGLMMAFRVLRDIQFSQKINYIEEQIKMMIIRDLEGDKETKSLSMEQRIERSIKAINLDHGGLNSACLPCSKKPRVYYTTA